MCMNVKTIIMIKNHGIKLSDIIRSKLLLTYKYWETV